LEEVKLTLSISTFFMIIFLFLMVVAVESADGDKTANAASASLSPSRRLMPPLQPATSAVLAPSLSMAALLAGATTIDISVSTLIYMYVHVVNKVRRKDRCHLLTIKIELFEGEAVAETGIGADQIRTRLSSGV
jgi:hypothetical protein